MLITLLPAQAWAEETPALYRSWYDPVTHQQRTEKLPDDAVVTPLPTDGVSSISLFSEDGDDELEIAPYFMKIDEHMNRYGWSKLETMKNSENLLALYGFILSLAIEYAYNPDADTPAESGYFIFVEGITFTAAEAELVTQAFYADWPEIFWAQPGYLYYENDASTCVGVNMGYNEYFTEDIETYQTRFLNAADKILKDMPVYSTAYDKELYLHDALIRHVTYDLEYAEQQNAYTALVKGKAVCAGYAFAFQYLLMRAGIESYYVTGTAGAENHAWNLVKIDSNWCYVDPTWDDSGDEYQPYHAYFNLTDGMLREDHTPDKLIPLEECNTVNLFYHNKKGSVFTTDAANLADFIVVMMNANNGIARVYVIDENPGNMETWITDNIGEIAGKRGISGQFTYTKGNCGREYVVDIPDTPVSPPNYDLNGSGSSDAADMQLLYAYLTTGIVGTTIAISEAEFLNRADVNQDGRVDVYDLQAIYQQLLLL